MRAFGTELSSPSSTAFENASSSLAREPAKSSTYFSHWPSWVPTRERLNSCGPRHGFVRALGEFDHDASAEQQAGPHPCQQRVGQRIRVGGLPFLSEEVERGLRVPVAALGVEIAIDRELRVAGCFLHRRPRRRGEGPPASLDCGPGASAPVVERSEVEERPRPQRWESSATPSRTDRAGSASPAWAR